MGRYVDKEVLKEYAEKYSNWGKWGPDDQLGTLNYITPDKIVAAAGLVKTGKVFSLTIPFDEHGPQYGRKNRYNPIRIMLHTGTDVNVGVGTGADDLLIMSTHGATHWDALSHFFIEHEDENGNVQKVMWNGYPCTIVDCYGAQKNGIQHTKDKMIGRGVLLDIARYKGCDYLEDGYEITSEDLDGCAKAEGIEIRQGDFVLFRTGKLARHMKEGWGTYVGGDAPGLQFETVEWIYKKEIATVAADTFGVEVRPNRAPFHQPWHHIALPMIGLIHGEMFNMEELAADCAADGRYEFLLVAPTLPLTNACGSMVNPIAIK